jgi:hypothetical protein
VLSVCIYYTTSLREKKRKKKEKLWILFFLFFSDSFKNDYVFLFLEFMRITFGVDDDDGESPFFLMAFLCAHEGISSI